jgi:hypothetical protein
MAILWIGSAAIVPTLIRLAMDHLVNDVTIFPAYFPFVLAAATFLGWRSAVVTAILSALAANFMFIGGALRIFRHYHRHRPPDRAWPYNFTSPRPRCVRRGRRIGRARRCG